jgi:hypothetical protein
VSRAGRISGKVMRRKVVAWLAPRSAEACSIDGCNCASAPTAVRWPAGMLRIT